MNQKLLVELLKRAGEDAMAHMVQGEPDHDDVNRLMDRAHARTVGDDGTAHGCRYELLKNGVPFAGCADPRKLLTASDWPEGDYDIRYFCLCGDPMNGDRFGSISTFAGAGGILRGIHNAVWIREE